LQVNDCGLARQIVSFAELRSFVAHAGNSDNPLAVSGMLDTPEKWLAKLREAAQGFVP